MATTRPQRIFYNGGRKLPAMLRTRMKGRPPMRRWLLIVALLCGLYVPGTQAESPDREGWRVLAQRSQERDAQRGGNRRDEERERRRERRQEADRQQRQYLTPDERRELNRDLQRANREIYRRGREKR